MTLQATKAFLAELQVLTHVHHTNLVYFFSSCVGLQLLSLAFGNQNDWQLTDLFLKTWISSAAQRTFLWLNPKPFDIGCVGMAVTGSIDWILHWPTFVSCVWVHWEWNPGSTSAWERYQQSFFHLLEKFSISSGIVSWFLRKNWLCRWVCKWSLLSSCRASDFVHDCYTICIMHSTCGTNPVFVVLGFGAVMPPLTWSQRVQIALDAARGLEYIHEHIKPTYIHRDIKSANILIDRDLHAKVRQTLFPI